MIFIFNRSIGLDLEPYRNIFDEYSVEGFSFFNLKSLSSSVEPMVSFMIVLVKKMGLDSRFFFLLIGGFSILLIIKVLIREEKDILLKSFAFFILVFFLKGPVDTLRAFLAASFYFMSLSYISRGRNLNAFMTILFSFFSHYSSVILFVSSFFLRVRWSLYGFLILFSFLFLLGIISSNFINYLDFSYLVDIHPAFFKIEYYLKYYESSDGYNYLNYSHKIFLFLFQFSFPFVVFFIVIHSLVMKNKSRYTDFELLCLNSSIIGLYAFSFLCGFGATTFSVRVLFLFSIGFFVLMGRNILISKNSNGVLIYYSIVILFSILFSLTYYAEFYNPDSPFGIFG